MDHQGSPTFTLSFFFLITLSRTSFIQFFVGGGSI